MKTTGPIDASKHDDVSAAALRLARIALDIPQKEAALSAGIGWRTIQRIELGEPVAADLLNKVKSEWERRGIVFLKPDPAGWGIREPKSDRKGPMGPGAMKALRIGMGMNVEQAAKLAKVTPQDIIRIESGQEVIDYVRDKVKNAYTEAGVRFLNPVKAAGWGFRIPESIASERGEVHLIRPRRLPEGTGAGDAPSLKRPRKASGKSKPRETTGSQGTKTQGKVNQ